MTRVLVVPAAGRGVRLGADLPKVLVPVNGKPMLQHLVELYQPFVTYVVVISAPGSASEIGSLLREWRTSGTVVVQAHPTGMLDAVLIGLGAFAFERFDRVWITWSDQVAVRLATLERLAAIERDADVALPTVPRETPYIHFARDAIGRITAVRQRREGDEMPAHGESDMGVFSLSRRAAADWLPEYAADILPGASTGERNFLPFIAWAAARGAVATCSCTEPIEAIGINTPEELALVERALRER